jgi:hypothetical protein
MPPATIAGKSVGTGDGITVSFKPPINFFIKDTDKVYVDGVQLTRDVDYTIDNFNNADNLWELLPSSHFIVCGGGVVGEPTTKRRTNNIYDRPATTIPWAIDHGIYSYRTPRIGYRGYGQSARLWLDNEHPWIVYCQANDLGLDGSFDTVYVYLDRVEDTFSLEQSVDGENWLPVLTNATGYKTGTRDINKLASWVQHDLPSVINPVYLRISFNSTYTKASTFNFRMLCRRKASNIVFTNPPAVGAVITMDADVDRPFKDSNHVLDLSATLQL